MKPILLHPHFYWKGHALNSPHVVVDKFVFRVASDCRYSPADVWASQREGNRVRIGLTDYLQQKSGDAAFVNLKPGWHCPRG